MNSDFIIFFYYWNWDLTWNCACNTLDDSDERFDWAFIHFYVGILFFVDCKLFTLWFLRSVVLVLLEIRTQDCNITDAELSGLSCLLLKWYRIVSVIERSQHSLEFLLAFHPFFHGIRSFCSVFDLLWSLDWSAVLLLSFVGSVGALLLGLAASGLLLLWRWRHRKYGLD